MPHKSGRKEYPSKPGHKNPIARAMKKVDDFMNERMPDDYKRMQARRKAAKKKP